MNNLLAILIITGISNSLIFTAASNETSNNEMFGALISTSSSNSNKKRSKPTSSPTEQSQKRLRTQTSEKKTFGFLGTIRRTKKAVVPIRADIAFHFLGLEPIYTLTEYSDTNRGSKLDIFKQSIQELTKEPLELPYRYKTLDAIAAFMRNFYVLTQAQGNPTSFSLSRINEIKTLMKKIITEDDFKELFSFVEDFNLNSVITDAIATFIARRPSQEYGLKKCFSNFVRRAAAKQRYLIEPFDIYWNTLPNEFKFGTSIQDYIDHGYVYPFPQANELLTVNLSKKYINDLTGLKNIERAHDLEVIFLNNNSIETIEPDMFANLPSLQTLCLQNNPIPEESRAEIITSLQKILPNLEVHF